MSDKELEELKRLWENGVSDSIVEDFCEEHNIPLSEAFHMLAEWSVPDCCKGCTYVSYYNSMYPCTSCSRPRRDMYKNK